MVNFTLNLIIIGIFKTTKIFQAGKGRREFKTGDKFKLWSREDFPCSKFECSNDNCQDSMLSNVEYGFNDFWFRNEKNSLGQGGFGKVFQFPFHGIDAAFKEIPIYFGNDRNKAIEQAYDEYDIMNTVSKKPEKGGKMMPKYGMDRYKTGMEEMILSPLSCFFMEEVSSQKVWMILVLPKLLSVLLFE